MNQSQEHSSQDLENRPAPVKSQNQTDPRQLDKIMERLDRMEKKLDSLLSKSENPKPFERNRPFPGGRRDFKFQSPRQDRPYFGGSHDSRRERPPQFQGRDRQPHFGSQEPHPQKPWYSKRKRFSPKHRPSH